MRVFPVLILLVLEIMLSLPIQACFKRLATAVPNSIARIKFDFSTTVARRLKTKSCYCRVARQALRATAVPNSIHKL